MKINLFDAVKTNQLNCRNRIAYSPFIEHQANRDGTVSRGMYEYYLDLARDGAGMVILESAYVIQQGRYNFNQLGISTEDHTEGLARLIGAMREEGAMVGVRLSHAGAKTSEAICGEQPVGPSILNFGKDYSTSREFDDGDLEEIILFFVHAAERAEEAGADFVEINGGQQHILDQCLSNKFNNRVDAYGGNIESRMKLTGDVIKAIRSRISTKLGVSFVFSIHDKIDDGFNESDLKTLVKMLNNSKVDFIHPVTIHVLNKFFETEETLVELVSRFTKCTVIAEGNIKSPQILKEAMTLKKPQIFSLDRAIFSRPNWFDFLERKFTL